MDVAARDRWALRWGWLQGHRPLPVRAAPVRTRVAERGYIEPAEYLLVASGYQAGCGVRAVRLWGRQVDGYLLGGQWLGVINQFGGPGVVCGCGRSDRLRRARL